MASVVHQPDTRSRDWIHDILNAFECLDVSRSGTIGRRELALLLMTIGPEVFDEDSTRKLLAAFDADAVSPIQYERFLNWCSVTDEVLQGFNARAGQAKDLRVEVGIVDLDGVPLALVNASPFDSVQTVKERFAALSVAALTFSSAPVESQQLLLNGVPLQDAEPLAGCGIMGPEVTLQLVVLQPPPLMLLDFTCVVAGTALGGTGGALELERTLALAFCGRDVNAPLRQEQDAKPSSTGSRSRRHEPLPEWPGGDCGEECGAPLWNLAQIRALPSRLATAARWLLGRGASPDTVFRERTALDECCLHANEAVLRVLLEHCGDALSCEQITQGLVSISSILGAAVFSDFGFQCGHQPLEARQRKEMAEQMRLEIDLAKGLGSFIEVIRRALHDHEWPADVLTRAALIGGSSGRELTLGEAGDCHAPLLVAAAHGGHCWALAEMVRRGLRWASPGGRGGELPGGLEPEALLAAADAQEARFRAAVACAELRAAVLRGDAEALRRLLAQKPHGHPPWPEGLLITAARCGSQPDVLAALLADPHLDPNLGTYEYKGGGRFELLSPLAWLATRPPGCWRGAGGATLEELVARLARHPRIDLGFGRVSGSRCRGGCRVEPPLALFRKAGLWRCVHSLLAEGALGSRPAPSASSSSSSSAPAAAAGEEGFAAEGAKDSPCPFTAPETWLATLGCDLALVLAGGRTASDKGWSDARLRAARRLQDWLRQVGTEAFSFERLRIYPPPYRNVAVALRRGLVASPPRWREPLPLRVVERILGFLAFWAFPPCARSYMEGLHLRRIDPGSGRTGGYTGCPVDEWELLLSGAQFSLARWAEEFYSSRGASDARA